MENQKKPTRRSDLQRFYALLQDLESRLGGARVISKCSGRDGWPQRGVYFFQEPSERRFDTGEGPRIVRVGTHGLKAGSGTKLWTRLSQHKGVTRSGGGNHRGSIFRLIVGAAIQQRDELDFSTWGRGSSAPRETREQELELEQIVSSEIGDMSVLWLPINDDPGPSSQRGYIERNSIALLSNYGKKPLDPPSSNWLGHSCDRPLIRDSGLWNSNHVSEIYDSGFLNALELLMEQMEEAS
jgi:hypothetical protein